MNCTHLNLGSVGYALLIITVLLCYFCTILSRSGDMEEGQGRYLFTRLALPIIVIAIILIFTQ